jgi:hypothetical protein
MTEYSFPVDLVERVEYALASLSQRTGIPYEALYREWVRRREEKAARAAAAREAADKAAAERAEAERKARTFTDADDQFDRLGRTEAMGDIGAVDGPFVKATFDKVEQMDQEEAARRQEFEIARREVLRQVNDHLGWDLDTTATRTTNSMRGEAGASQGAAFLIVKGEAKTWAEAQRQLQDGKLGWIPPTINRKRSKHGKTNKISKPRKKPRK